MGWDRLENGQKKRRASDYIRQLPARNLHHAIRLARSKGVELNLFVSINFSLTDCVEEKVDLAFRAVREVFGKWITRPRKKAAAIKTSPTFVWVIENPNGCIHAHWLVHVPLARQFDFRTKLNKWILSATGAVNSEKAIQIKQAKTPTGLGKYMLKGMYPSMARNFNIDPEYQGWVTGRRIGHSKNLGPVQIALMRKLGLHPPARRWVHGLFTRELPVTEIN